jgi:hypothetical protein
MGYSVDIKFLQRVKGGENNNEWNLKVENIKWIVDQIKDTLLWIWVGHAMSQVASGRPMTAEARVSACGML